MREEYEWMRRRRERDLPSWNREFSLDPPDYTEIQQLLNSETAVIYWYLCPAALTTFVLRDNQPLIAWTLTPKSIHEYSTQADAHHLQEFEEWIKQWKRNYQDYRNSKAKVRDTQSSSAELENQSLESYPWQSQMHDELVKLAEILDIKRILNHLDSHVKQLILIPHGDLHLLPLHYLFGLDSPQDFTITYLPSAKVGLDLQKRSTQFSSRLLSVEDPETQRTVDTRQQMLYAEIESAVIAQQYSSKRIAGREATRDQVKEALETGADIFHFTGHAYHNIDNPLKSALAFAGEDLLTLRDIFQLDLHTYSLVCLSACETGITSKQGLIDEFVGLSSGFLAAGVAHVVSTLWTVDEISSALIMIEFYRRFKAGATPPEALKQAKHWLRTIAYYDLAKWYKERAAEVEHYDLGCCEILESAASNAEEEAKKKGATNCPYIHPYYWAGFTITGKAPTDADK